MNKLTHCFTCNSDDIIFACQIFSGTFNTCQIKSFPTVTFGDTIQWQQQSSLVAYWFSVSGDYGSNLLIGGENNFIFEL